MEIKMCNSSNHNLRALFCLAVINALIISSCTPNQPKPKKPDVTSPLATSTKAELLYVLTSSPTLIESTSTEPVLAPALSEIPTESPTETPEPTATANPESNIPRDIPTEKNENFDFRATDLLNWNDYQLVEVETLDVSETVETAYEGENHLYLMPTFDLGLIRENAIVNLTLPTGYTFNIKEKRLLKNSNGEILVLGIIEDSGAFATSKTKFVLLLNATDMQNETQGFVREKEKNENVVTIINSAERECLKVVQGELLSFQRILQYQEEIGGFKPGEEISLFNILQPMNSFPMETDGQRRGYPAGTEFLASVLNRLSQKEDSCIERVQFRQYTFPFMPGPFSIEEGYWPTAIGYTKDSDFIFKIISDDSEVRYFFNIEPIFSNIDITKSLLYESQPFSKEDQRIIDGATISLVKEKPESQMEMINTLLENYNQYIDNNATVPMVIPQGITMEKYYLSENNLKELCGDEKPFPYIPFTKVLEYFDL